MANRPSVPELVGVWSTGLAAEIAAGHVVENAGEVIEAAEVAALVLFFVTPLFLVAYSLIWAWPLALAGQPHVTGGLTAFAVAVELAALGFSAGGQGLSHASILARLVALLAPALFVAFVAAVAWARARAANDGGRRSGRSG